MIPILLGLGSNKSYNNLESVELLRLAVRMLSSFVKNITLSSVYKTRAMYVENQDDFYNMVLYGEVQDSINAEQLLELIHYVETSLGRNREKEIRFGPRSVDIDIEFYGNSQIKLPNLVIPHERINERPFVLIPLLEILPKCADFVDMKKIANNAKKIVRKENNLKPCFSAEGFLCE